MANYKKLPHSKIEFSLEISKDDLAKAQKSVIQKFKQNVEVKGFRKGHAPEEMVVASVGMNTIVSEAFSYTIDKKYREFIIANKLSPISQPEVEIDDKKEPIQVKVKVEVYPEVEIGDYKKLKIELPKIKVTEKEIDDVVETILSDMKLGKEVKRAAKAKDLVEIDFRGKDEKGETIPNTDAKNHKLRIGMGFMLEDLEKGIEGMKAGEEKTDIKVKFPKNYHAKNMAGKTIPFDVKLHKVEEISAKNIDEDTITKVTGKKKSVEEFRKDLKELIIGNKTKSEREKKSREFDQKLAKIVKVDLPESWLKAEVNAQLARLKQSPQYQHDPAAFWKAIGKTEEEIKKEFAKNGEISLKTYLGLAKIMEKEKIELNKDELAEAEKRVEYRLSQLDDKSEATKKRLMDQTIQSMKIDKYIDSITI